jgi:hypothetical protein
MKFILQLGLQQGIFVRAGNINTKLEFRAEEGVHLKRLCFALLL